MRNYLFFALDLDTDLEPNGSGDGALVRPLLQVVPDVHLAGQSPHLNDRLAQEVIRFSRQLLAQFGLEVVVLVPDTHFDPIRRVVAFTRTRKRDKKINSEVCCH